jgi:HD-GYP domain-containing protein (c-di-GMP phosphodiesterase class II)
MDPELALAQALRYAEELRQVYDSERAQRRALEDALGRLESSYATTVRALAAALELRDDQTGGHAERVTRAALELAGDLDPDLARDPELEYGFLLHDLGKIGVPDAILLKPGALTPDERRLIEYHPLLGEQIVERIPYLQGRAREVIAAHHEHWDGGGYPHGLRRKRIPAAARIFAVVDAFDAMTNDRPYRSALPVEAALAELRRNSGTQFEPAVVDAFTALAAQMEAVA